MRRTYEKTLTRIVGLSLVGGVALAGCSSQEAHPASDKPSVSAPQGQTERQSPLPKIVRPENGKCGEGLVLEHYVGMAILNQADQDAVLEGKFPESVQRLKSDLAGQHLVPDFTRLVVPDQIPPQGPGARPYEIENDIRTYLGNEPLPPQPLNYSADPSMPKDLVSFQLAIEACNPPSDTQPPITNI